MHKKIVDTMSKDYSNQSRRLNNLEVLFDNKNLRTKIINDLEETNQVAQKAEDYSN